MCRRFAALGALVLALILPASAWPNSQDIDTQTFKPAVGALGLGVIARPDVRIVYRQTQRFREQIARHVGCNDAVAPDRPGRPDGG